MLRNKGAQRVKKKKNQACYRNNALSCWPDMNNGYNKLSKINCFYVHICMASVSCHQRASVLKRAVCVRSPYFLKPRGGSHVWKSARGFVWKSLFSPTFPDLLWPYTLQISTTISYCNDEIGAKRGLVRKQKQVSAWIGLENWNLHWNKLKITLVSKFFVVIVPSLKTVIA